MRSWGLILLVVIGGLALLVFLAPTRLSRRSLYQQSVCTLCGLQKTEQSRHFGPVRTVHRETLEPTAISWALQVTGCTHDWLRYRFGNSYGSLLGAKVHADGGSPATSLPLLLLTGEIGRELAKMENPTNAWSRLVRALDQSRAFDQAFGEWSMNNPDSQGFAEWCRTNTHWPAGRPR